MKNTKILCMTIIALFVSTALLGAIPVAAEEKSFEMDIFTRPNSLKLSDPIVYDAIADQNCIFPVTVSNLTGVNEVHISATINGSGGATVDVVMNTIGEGQVAEVIATPKTSNVGNVLTLTIKGVASGFIVTEIVYINVISGVDDIQEDAEDIQSMFLPWIIENYPELGIDNDTAWESTVVKPLMWVVKHYIFLSEDWEMYVEWHMTIPPDNWARVYLRSRHTEIAPSIAFEIECWTDPADPYPIDVPVWV